MTRESIVHFSIFLNQKQDLEYYLAHELNTVSVDVSENIELKNAFYLHFLVTSDPNLMSPRSKILVTLLWTERSLQVVLNQLRNCELYQVDGKAI